MRRPEEPRPAPSSAPLPGPRPGAGGGGGFSSKPWSKPANTKWDDTIDGPKIIANLILMHI